MLFSEADAIRLGATDADKVYLGANQVWPVGGGGGPVTFGAVTFFDGSNGNPTLIKPDGTVAGSLLIAICGIQNAATWNAAAGWSSPLALSSRQAVYYKIAGGSEPASYTFTRTGGSGGIHCSLSRWEGADATTPISASAGVDVSGKNGSSPSVTVPDNGSLLFCQIIAESLNSTSVAAPAGMTQVYASSSPTFRVLSTQPVDTGVTGAKAYTHSYAVAIATSLVLKSAG